MELDALKLAHELENFDVCTGTSDEYLDLAAACLREQNEKIGDLKACAAVQSDEIKHLLSSKLNLFQRLAVALKNG